MARPSEPDGARWLHVCALVLRRVVHVCQQHLYRCVFVQSDEDGHSMTDANVMSKSNLSEMMGQSMQSARMQIRAICCRDGNLVRYSWRTNCRGLHATELIQGRFCVRNDIGVDLADRCGYFCGSRSGNVDEAGSETRNQTKRARLANQ